MQKELVVRRFGFSGTCRWLSARALIRGAGVVLVAASALAACDAETGSTVDAHTEGALGFAPPIAYGASVTGQVASPQLDIWALKVKAGDAFRLTETVSGGDLKPDLVVFRGTVRDHLPSTDYDAAETSLRKDYETDRDGTYYVVVRGYRNQGAGSYTLQAECLAGPCAGETPPPPVVELDDQQKAECVRKARECSVAALPAYNGYVGSVRAKQIFDRCLGETTVESWESDIPASCAPACQGEDEAYVCDAIVSLLPWLADQTPECIDTYNGCIEDCYDAGYGQADEAVLEGGEGVCTTGEAAFNGSCVDVRDLTTCGGRWEPDSCEACYIECYYTFGAWNDDLDTICTDACACERSDDF
jgi:hypothetical protein